MILGRLESPTNGETHAEKQTDHRRRGAGRTAEHARRRRTRAGRTDRRGAGAGELRDDEPLDCPVHVLERHQDRTAGGYYQGYQYGWARIAPESNWNQNDIIGLEINDHGRGWQLVHLTIKDGDVWENTAAQITQASSGYQFRAAFYRNNQRVDHTDPW